MSEQPERKPEPSAPVIKELSGRIGKYDILKPLGKGAMGMVYLAHDTVLERDVALKVMVASIADDPELNQRFVREAKAVAKMNHPNVVNVFDLGNHTDGSPYIAMEVLRGQDLQKAMRATPPLTLDRKVNIMVQVLVGLAHAHQAGIVHRDIKPANIFLTQDGTVKIMDFGVARLTTASMTGTGSIVGTADYMSPEQVKGAKVDGRSDVFSVGCMLYELLTGRRPFHADNLMAIFYKITHEEPNYDLVPEGADYDALMPILKKALARNLEERFQTAYDFAIALREYLKSYSTSATGQHALEGLVDLEPPPTGLPQPMTEAPGATVISADESELVGTAGMAPTAGRSTAPTVGRTGAPTVQMGAAPTVAATRMKGGAAPTVMAPGAARKLPATPAPPSARPAPAPAGNPVLYVVLGGMGVLLLVAGGYIYLSRKPEPGPTPPPVSLTAPPPTAAPPPTQAESTPAPPTPAPPPTFAETKGKGATAMKAAQAAFGKGDYAKALSNVQEALKEDPANAEAKRVVENSLKGQKAEGHFRAAEAALKQSDFAQAGKEADAGRALAPWDGRGTDLVSRIQGAQLQVEQAAQQQKQQQTAAQLNALLTQADAALGASKYEEAIRLYDEVLAKDPQNQRANLARTGAVSARAVAQAAALGAAKAAPAHAFSSGATVAQAAEKATGAVPSGFEDTPGVQAKKGTEAAAMPGKITFSVKPEAVKAGDKYTTEIFLLNEGAAPIQIKEMIVTNAINGRKSTGPVMPLAKEVAPQQKALLLSLPDFWKEDTASWSLEVLVRTIRGETYKSQVTWK